MPNQGTPRHAESPTVLSLMLALALCACAWAPVHAQEPAKADTMAATEAAGSDDGTAPAEVERVTFRGVESLEESELRASIATRETGCKSPLLRPICALGSWDLLVDRHYLDEEAVREDEARLRIHYYQRGYRSAQVASAVLPTGKDVEVVFTIEEGPATRIESWSLRQNGDVLSDRRIRRALLPEEGDALDLLRIVEGLEDIAGAYGERGYLDAELRDSIAVTPDGLRARVSIELEPGPRSTLEELDVQGNNRVSEAAIENALMLRPGEVLRTTDLTASQRSLYESNLFHEARVRVPEQPDSAKRVRVTVREAPPRGARVGAGFNSIEFFQAEGRYTHYDWLGGSRRLDLRAAVGNLLARSLNGQTVFRDVLPPESGVVDRDEFLRPTWQVSAEFRQPTFLAAANVLSFSAFAHRRTIPAISVDEGYGGDVSATRRLDYPTAITTSYRFELSNVQAGDLYFCANYGICEPVTIDALRSSHRISPVSLTFVDERVDEPLSPTSGYRLNVGIEHASALTQSDFAYQRITATGAYYHPLDLHRRRVLAGQLRVGWVRPLGGTAERVGLSEETELLHPRKRFFAGGARSVRGYHENQLGPRVLTVDPNALLEHTGCTRPDLVDGTCDPAAVPVGDLLPRPVGGRSIVEASVEYRFPIGDVIMGAVFIDGALVGGGVRELLQEGGRAITPGFGARLRSPVGPIRVDLGVRPLLREELPVITEYMDEDGVRHLVRLETPYDYDPLAESSGFLDEVLGRLVLHLSIGEAF